MFRIKIFPLLCLSVILLLGCEKNNTKTINKTINKTNIKDTNTKVTAITATIPKVKSTTFIGLMDSLQQKKIPVLTKDTATVVYKNMLNNTKGSIKSNKKPMLLITGDSMGDGLYLAFLKKAKIRKNYTVKYVPWYGSTTVWWGKSDTLQKIIKKHHPDFVLFTLGSNELFIPNIKGRQIFIDKILQQIDSTNYTWVGPPNWKPDTGIHEMVAKSVGNDKFFASKDMVFERVKDGAHPTFKASEFWADSIENWLQSQKNCPKFLKKNL